MQPCLAATSRSVAIQSGRFSSKTTTESRWTLARRRPQTVRNTGAPVNTVPERASAPCRPRCVRTNRSSLNHALPVRGNTLKIGCAVDSRPAGTSQITRADAREQTTSHPTPNSNRASSLAGKVRRRISLAPFRSPEPRRKQYTGKCVNNAPSPLHEASLGIPFKGKRDCERHGCPAGQRREAHRTRSSPYRHPVEYPHFRV